jgi:GH18 family chitinase
MYKRHGIKVSLGLGGWNDSAGDKYSKLVNDPSARAKFIAHAIPFLEQYGFDGLDLDWEYPKCWQVGCINTYIPYTLDPRRNSRGFLNIPPGRPRFTKMT